jgi:excisionase family DNA binding protein
MLLDADRDGWPKHSDLPPIGNAALGRSCFRKEIAMTEQFRRKLMSIESAANYLDCSTKTVRRRIASGDLPAYRVGSTHVIRVDLSEVDALLKPIPTAGSGGGHAA